LKLSQLNILNKKTQITSNCIHIVLISNTGVWFQIVFPLWVWGTISRVVVTNRGGSRLVGMYSLLNSNLIGWQLSAWMACVTWLAVAVKSFGYENHFDLLRVLRQNVLCYLIGVLKLICFG